MQHKPAGTGQRLIDVLQASHMERRGMDELLGKLGFSDNSIKAIDENLAAYLLQFAGQMPRRVTTGELSEFRLRLLKYAERLKEYNLSIRDATAAFLLSGLAVQQFFEGMK